jgi:hypothetical protein
MGSKFKYFVEFLIVFIVTSSCLVPQSLPDYFPIEIGKQFRYSYQSIEKNYFDLSYMYKMITDTGIIQYRFINKTEENTLIKW